VRTDYRMFYVFVGAVCTMCTLGGLSLLTAANIRILSTCVWIRMCICICVYFFRHFDSFIICI